MINSPTIGTFAFPVLSGTQTNASIASPSIAPFATGSTWVFEEVVLLVLGY